MSQDIEDFFGLPTNPEKMNRKERRAWYNKNRKKLKLPRWGDLSKTLI